MKKTMRLAYIIFFSLIAAQQAAAAPGDLRAVFLDKCPTSDYPVTGSQYESFGALGALVAGTFLNGLVDTGITALKNKVNPTKEMSTITARFLQDGLYESEKIEDLDNPGRTKNKITPNSKHACLVVALGEFGRRPPQWQLPFEAAKARPTAVQTLTNSLGLVAAPVFYFEAVRVFSIDKTALTWKPVRVYQSKFLNESFFAGKKRGIALSLEMEKAGGDPVGTLNFEFDEVTLPFSKSDVDLDTGLVKLGTWMTLPVASDAADLDLTPPAGEARTPIDPFTLKVTFVETPKPYQLAQLFANSVEANSEAIKTEVQNAAFPDKRKAASREKKSETLTAMSTYLEKHSNATEACEAEKIKTEIGKASCHIAIETAKIERQKVQAACDVGSVEGCSTLPKATNDVFIKP